MHFGRIDKTDFLIPPFALFYFYTVFAAAFNLPSVSTQTFFHSELLSWVGVLLCIAGLVLLLLSLVAFGKSFRVGIDVDHADKLVTTGVFAFSRNPIYVAFGFVLFGQFLVFPDAHAAGALGPSPCSPDDAERAGHSALHMVAPWSLTSRSADTSRPPRRVRR
jgi:protein-S-isoprenylcysteine O-methyltransferase Ste14